MRPAPFGPSNLHGGAWDMALPEHPTLRFQHDPPAYQGVDVHPPFMDIHSLTRSELIALIESERSSSHYTDFPEEKDAIIESLRVQLQSCERRNQELQSMIRELRAELSAVSNHECGSNNLPRSAGTSTASGHSPIVEVRRGHKISSGSNGYSGGRNLDNSPSNNSGNSTSTASISMNPDDTGIIAKLQTLNNTIVSTATVLSKQLQYNDLLITIPDRRTMDGIQQSFVRTSWVVGEKIATELASHPLPKDCYEDKPPTLLAQMMFESVFAKWCAFILRYIDDDVTNGGVEAYNWYRGIQELRSSPITNDNWLSSIMNCIRDITYIAGWAFKSNSNNEANFSLSPIIIAIQGLRKSLDELSTTPQHLEVHLIKAGSQFETSRSAMVDAFAVGKRAMFSIRRKPVSGDIVAASTGLGLKSLANPDKPRTVAPPRIVLERAFLDAFSKSAQFEEPRVRVRVGGGRSAAVSSSVKPAVKVDV
ncbi:hypothetical protein FA15DRAFT_662920 [Coprinopsis marcescibilis]|uniref:Uncharacterized protein n=1 Tax=Coprinopsis marcescibilis TaxID=230819 RepID=A0A5C3LDG5_COPMA|nr:hypothetical protein FA15DRAFT_662920 [Coprinopsis marcescibilis]